MTLSLPTRIPPLGACCFALCLWVVQAWEGTAGPFSLLCFLFVMLSTLAFNVCGGLSRPSGAYIFFFSTLGALVGIVSKAYFHERADSYLQLPLLTMALYTAGVFMMLVAAYLSRILRAQEGLFVRASGARDWRLPSIGCLLIGILVPIVANGILSGPETILTPLAIASRQLNGFLAFAIILDVTHTISITQGRRSVGVITILSGTALFVSGGLISYSKQAMFTPVVCWLATAVSRRYCFRVTHVLCLGAMLILLFRYMVPYSQYGRSFLVPEATLSQNAAVSLDLLSRLPEVRTIYEEGQEELYEQEGVSYFSSPHGLLDRLQMFSMDSKLIKVTEDQGPLGFKIVVDYIKNTVPRIFWKNKPELNNANRYGQEVGGLPPDDETTSVSFSPIGEAYRILKWYGVLVLIPVELFCLFVVYDSLVGDLRASPWGIFPLVAFAHMAPEGGIAGPLYSLSYGLFSLVLAFFVITYILPVIISSVMPVRLRQRHRRQ